MRTKPRARVRRRQRTRGGAGEGRGEARRGGSAARGWAAWRGAAGARGQSSGAGESGIRGGARGGKYGWGEDAGTESGKEGPGEEQGWGDKKRGRESAVGTRNGGGAGGSEREMGLGKDGWRQKNGDEEPNRRLKKQVLRAWKREERETWGCDQRKAAGVRTVREGWSLGPAWPGPWWCCISGGVSLSHRWAESRDALWALPCGWDSQARLQDSVHLPTPLATWHSSCPPQLLLQLG